MTDSPALTLLQFDSVAAGIVAADAMVKRAPLSGLTLGTVQPGHYLVLAAGDTASVTEALEEARAVASESLIDEVFLPDVHPAVVDAIRGVRATGRVEALGVIETTLAAASIEAADAGVKGASVELFEINIADGLGGKAYVLFGGAVSDVEAAVEAGAARVAADRIVRTEVVSQLHADVADNLEAHPHFEDRIRRPGVPDAAG